MLQIVEQDSKKVRKQQRKAKSAFARAARLSAIEERKHALQLTLKQFGRDELEIMGLDKAPVIDIAAHVNFGSFISPYGSTEKERDVLRTTAKALMRKHNISVPDLAREDLTHIPFITIDPDNAFEQDDAVHVHFDKQTGTYKIYYAVSDVDFFVKRDSYIDAASEKRGETIYLLDNALPMMPSAISRNLFSLLPQQKRMAIVTEIDMDADGTLLNVKRHFGNIKVHQALTYQEVQDYLNTQQTDHKIDSKSAACINNLAKLEDLLRDAGIDRGEINFGERRLKPVLSKALSLEGFVPDHTDHARVLIERVTGLVSHLRGLYIKQRVGARGPIYRNQSEISPEQSLKITNTAAKWGLRLPRDIHENESLSRADIHVLHKQACHMGIQRQFESLINTEVNSQWCRASYDNKNEGHFALGYAAYCQGSSPIRSRSNLIAQRAEKYAMLKDKGVPDFALREYYPEALWSPSYAEIKRLNEQERLTDRFASTYNRIRMYQLMQKQFPAAQKHGENFIVKANVHHLRANGLVLQLQDYPLNVTLTLDDLPKHIHAALARANGLDTRKADVNILAHALRITDVELVIESFDPQTLAPKFIEKSCFEARKQASRRPQTANIA